MMWQKLPLPPLAGPWTFQPTSRCWTELDSPATMQKCAMKEL